MDYSGRLFKDADDLMMQGQFGRAAGAYEEWLELMAHRKMQGTDLWNDASAKLREAEFARRWREGELATRCVGSGLATPCLRPHSATEAVTLSL